MIYKTIRRSLIDYTTPAWNPSISDTQLRNLHTVQNFALRTASVFHIPGELLHHEARLESFREHCTNHTIESSTERPITRAMR